MAFLTAVPTNNVLSWIRVLVLMLTFFLDALAITFPFLALLAFLASFAKAVHLHRSEVLFVATVLNANSLRRVSM